MVSVINFLDTFYTVLIKQQNTYNVDDTRNFKCSKTELSNDLKNGLA